MNHFGNGTKTKVDKSQAYNFYFSLAIQMNVASVMKILALCRKIKKLQVCINPNRLETFCSIGF